MAADEIVLSTWAHVREAFRSKDLRQAMYSEGAVVMADCLLDLHGPEHRQRRRIENRLFRRETFAAWEHDVLGTTIDQTLQPIVDAGRGDLLTIGYRCAMSLTAHIAGVDHDPTDADATERLYATVKTFSEGATLVHSTRDRDQVRAEVREAIRVFADDLLAPSIERRRALIEAGDDDALPRDVLTTLLLNQDELDLDPDVVVREICFYLQAGAHSTANAFTHTVDEIFALAQRRPDVVARARRDRGYVQRCVHEALRCNPASPVAWRTPTVDVELRDGTVLPAGARIVLDLAAANRDTDAFGPDAHHFDPERVVPDSIPAWGHSFGGGMHACIGAELDGGLECPAPPADPSHGSAPDPDHLYGTVAIMVHAFLGAGGRPDPNAPAQLDAGSERRHFSSYPVLFDAPAP